MKKAYALAGLHRATDFSIGYLGAYLVVGFIPIFLLLALGLGVVEIILRAHIIGTLVMLPGAIVVNLIGLRCACAREWRRDPKRSRRAAVRSVLLFWLGVLVMMAVSIPPPAFVLRRMPADWAWTLHLTGWMCLASSSGLVAA